MRMNISVPDELAEQVRLRDIPISAICQRALRDEVDRLRRIEDADDILVYVESQQPDPDPGMWPGYDPAKPRLIYQRYQVGRRWELGWVLTYEEGDNPNDVFTSGDPGDPPIEWARGVVRAAAEERDRDHMGPITVEVGDPALTVGFSGRWLVEPDPDGTRTEGDAYDVGTYWGVALTKRGRIAVYSSHRDDGRPASLSHYDSLDEAADHWVPANIIARAAAGLGGQRVLWRDI
jgi:hypothetical protein